MTTSSDSGATGDPLEPNLPSITSRYLLVINVPLYLGGDGVLRAGQLWFKDLAEHLSYLDRFILACPIIPGLPSEVAVALQSDPRFASVRVVGLPVSRSLLHALAVLPLTAWRLFRAVRGAEVIHAGIAGWPIPYGWLVTPLARLLGRKLVIIVESAPWRPSPGLRQGLKARLTGAVYERMARYCLKRANLAIFTQDEYRRSLLARDPERGHVIHASWIDKEAIISDAEAESVWREKRAQHPHRLSILFAGRLDPGKGVTVLLEAMRLAARDDIPVTLDILGSGELEPQCRKISAELQGSTRVNVLGTVAYGPPLFELLRRHDAVVVPSVSDEQPRIVYDAYSQGVPLLASGTAGLRDCIEDGVTGWLIAPNDPGALCAAIARAASATEQLERLGMQSLRAARSMTHRQMHLKRQRLLLQLTRTAGA